MKKYILGLLLISSAAGVFGQTLTPVTNLTATFKGTKVVVLKWPDNNSGEDGYSVEASYKTDGYRSPWIVITNLPPNTTTTSHKPGDRRVFWSYRVKACKGHNCAPDSNIATIYSR